uniref:NAD(P)(+)--arginine ADP-ribosyltransferase n=1 Tax=Sinocyclocheilus grahami TaxID=75366 RepID=A0A672RP30_SINGR
YLCTNVCTFCFLQFFATAGAGYPLDMALNSVDDQYDGCKETMKHLENLGKEMFLNDLNLDYQEGEKNAKKPEDNLKKINSVSIYMYTNNNSDVYRDFNNAVRSEKQKYKKGPFKWYSLHFLLTDAIQILKKTQNKCYLTYRGTNVELGKDVLNKEIRLGSFTSSSLNRKVAQDFGTKSCFEIETCEGADVIKYSKYPDQKEVLIPPYETFKVTAVKKRADQKDPWCDTVYILKKTGRKSYLNCRVDK